jgi:hypothetical protein
MKFHLWGSNVRGYLFNWGSSRLQFLHLETETTIHGRDNMIDYWRSKNKDQDASLLGSLQPSSKILSLAITQTIGTYSTTLLEACSTLTIVLRETSLTLLSMLRESYKPTCKLTSLQCLTNLLASPLNLMSFLTINRNNLNKMAITMTVEFSEWCLI